MFDYLQSLAKGAKRSSAKYSLGSQAEKICETFLYIKVGELTLTKKKNSKDLNRLIKSK